MAVCNHLLLCPSPLCAPIALETEFAPAAKVEQDAVARLGLQPEECTLPIEQAFAVRLDTCLQTVRDTDTLKARLSSVTYDFVLYSRKPDGTPERWPPKGWITGPLSALVQCLEYAVLSPSLLMQGMDYLEDGVQSSAGVLLEADIPHILSRLGTILKQKPGMQTTRIATAIVANALNFHTSLVGTHPIRTLDELRDNSKAERPMLKSEVLTEWERILRDINYWPIFRIASDLLYPIPGDVANRVLTSLATTASRLAGIGAMTLHDMAGRMLQQLIADRKLLATFYTLPLSAALLAELAVDRLPMEGTDAAAYTRLRIGDLACGTGTLISAAYQALLSRYRRAGGNDRSLHKPMLEHSLYALDIMPVATHLAASQLASAHPGTTFEGTQIHTMEYGVNADTQEPAIGSLELLSGQPQTSLFSTHEQVRGDANARGKGTSWVTITPGMLDLVIMNPPFTRPTNHEKTDKVEPSFAGLDTPEAEQKMMARRLRTLRSGLPHPVGNGNAGLASNFLDLADFMLKKGQGILAMVLPFAFVQGGSWSAARKLLVCHYTDLTILSIAAPQRIDRSWSADTHMAEVMVLGTRSVTTQKTA